jgi:hypothetical protein
VTVVPDTIPGLSAATVVRELERHGFGHRSSKNASAEDLALEVVELWRWDSKTLHSAIVVRQGDAVRLVSVPILAFRADERRSLDLTAAAYLGAIAQLSYTGAEPERARLWVRENIANPGAEATIGGAVFVIEAPETVPGEQYRLTIVAPGARPRRT